jgi:hypothetical protein
MSLPFAFPTVLTDGRTIAIIGLPIAENFRRCYNHLANGRRALALLVISGLVALAPLAHASPPDAAWMGWHLGRS